MKFMAPLTRGYAPPFTIFFPRALGSTVFPAACCALASLISPYTLPMDARIEKTGPRNLPILPSGPLIALVAAFIGFTFPATLATPAAALPTPVATLPANLPTPLFAILLPIPVFATLLAILLSIPPLLAAFAAVGALANFPAASLNPVGDVADFTNPLSPIFFTVSFTLSPTLVIFFPKLSSFFIIHIPEIPFSMDAKLRACSLI